MEQRVIDTLRNVFELNGFIGIETRAVEQGSSLLKKGETSKEIYLLSRLQEVGHESDTPIEERLGLHFDLTVPLSRYVVEHSGALAFPFKRWQIQKVWRGERPQEGRFREFVQADIDEGPAHARHAMSMVAALLLERFQNGAAPLAVVSMDNCSHNGEKLQTSVMTIAKAWLEKGYVDQDFIDYLTDESKIAFPWSMIDKITPRPHKIVEEQLVKDGIEGMEPIVTSKNTFIAAFVNAERPQYLVIEDKFPNGRPALEKAGVYLTDRDTVNKTERMKVTTCLNPLHTAMSVYGCMLGYTLICDEMKDADIVALIKRLGYVEGLPVVVNPGILEPKAFIDEVVEQRLPNPFMPDAPQRIATDTSQKVGIRFGETIKSYVAEGRDLNTLVSIPLAIAGWLRYLLAVDDNGNAFEVSADPLKDDLQAKLATIKFGAPDSCTDQLDSILSNASIFGSDLTKTVLADKVKAYFKAEIAGPGAVRKTLHDAVNA